MMHLIIEFIIYAIAGLYIGEHVSKHIHSVFSFFTNEHTYNFLKEITMLGAAVSSLAVRKKDTMTNDEMLAKLPPHVKAAMQQKLPPKKENVFEDIGHGLEDVGKDILHIFTYVTIFEKIFSDSVQAAPEVKQLIGQVFDDLKPLITILGATITSEGKNFIEDADALTTFISTAKTVVADFKTAVPIIEANFKNLS